MEPDHPHPPGQQPCAGQHPFVGARPVSQRVLAGVGDCPQSVQALVAALDRVCAEDLPADLATSGVIEDRLIVLARVRTVLDAEVGRTLTAAQACDVLRHSPTTTLQRDAQWSGSASAAVLAAARLCDRHPDLAHLWRTGQVNNDVVAVLARGLHGVTATVEHQVVTALLPQLPHLSVAAMRIVVSRLLDLLRPQTRDHAEQSNYDRRHLSATHHGGMTMITADLPGIDGAAVMAALEALAESLRVEGDGHTRAQRRADALITLVNAAAAHGDLPATASGLAVAATITVGVSEADRVATGASRPPVTDVAEAVRDAADPAALTASGTPAGPTTLGDAALRFALCTGTLTGVLINDQHRPDLPISQALAATHAQPLAVGRSMRLATTYQRIALAVRDGGCLLCHRPPAECQTHHVVDWAHGGRTDLDHMVLLCWAHHRQVDLNRWKITRTTDPSPGAPYWQVTPVPRDQWRRRPTAA